ncbi:hypothetical protein GCM10011521_21630 [Arenimonas soli]|uniref:Glycoside hydrolase family 42 N-terminal domain-containing protein n=1 Tax=Arenimonas soli TaxID=2269504 RepID=A0ABQ1HM60_9GAMM|nr:hypothetical protein [Arenimonas soli]GGA82999.1 hypothetical protein GCM10011521_21630 [Arenimonas soli]
MPLRAAAFMMIASLGLLLAACRPSEPVPAALPASGVQDPQASAVPAPAPARHVAAHWFGRQWPKNFLSGFRREHVAEDFARLRADGFDTVVLLVAWGDFQPVFEPCCRYDERAFERLRFLLDRADEAGLKVMLRLGYGWSFHPEAGDIGERQQRVLNQPEVRAAFHAFLQRVSREVQDRESVVLAFMSWEDLWLRRVDESARADWLAYLATLPANEARSDALPDPVQDARLFHGYWDWLLVERFMKPAADLFPALSLEVRVDSDPRFETGPDGQPVVAEWIGHPGMLALPAGQPLTIYWAPYWGALNQGERLPAERSLELLDTMLGQFAQAGRPMFIDQFNFVDNTPGHDNNAVIRPEDTAAFLHAAVCTMAAHPVMGYGLWTTRDYAENPLHNPAFGYGLEGWTLQRAQGAADAALEPLASGDFQLAFADGDQLRQWVPRRHGRLPRTGDALQDQVCVQAEVRTPGVIEVRAGAEPASLAFDATGLQRRCAPIAPAPGESELEVLLLARGGDFALRDVLLFDHVQYGGLYALDGTPAPLLEPVQRMNRDFADGASRCR